MHERLCMRTLRSTYLTQDVQQSHTALTLTTQVLLILMSPYYSSNPGSCCVRTLPAEDKTIGFFVACFARTEGEKSDAIMADMPSLPSDTCQHQRNKRKAVDESSNSRPKNATLQNDISTTATQSQLHRANRSARTHESTTSTITGTADLMQQPEILHHGPKRDAAKPTTVPIADPNIMVPDHQQRNRKKRRPRKKKRKMVHSIAS